MMDAINNTIKNTTFMSYSNWQSKKSKIKSSGSKIVTGFSAASVLIASQLLYVKLTTPSLTAPHTQDGFELNGHLVNGYSNRNNGLYTKEISSSQESYKVGNDENEIRIVIIGDSTVEGIGSDTKTMTMCGQTAVAISRAMQKPVRYWSLGKSGLKAGQVENEMVPLLKQVSETYDIDLVIVSCGTNNLLLHGQSTSVFQNEYESLLDSIERCKIDAKVPIFAVGFFDLSTIPLFPFPLSHVLGYRSRLYQRTLESIMERRSNQRSMAVVNWPNVHRLKNCIEDPMLRTVTMKDKLTLGLMDFFAEDGFHPAKYGSIIMGNQLAQSYTELIYFEQERRG